MEELTCAKCGSGLIIDKETEKIVCTGCGDVINDDNQIKNVIYEDSDVCPKCKAGLKEISVGKFVCQYCESLYIGSEWYEEQEKQEKINEHTRLYKFSGDTKDEIISKFYSGISRMKGAPANFPERTTIKEIMHMYVTFYTYDVNISGTYTCEVGIEKIVKKYNKEKQRMEDVKETEWFPQNGTVSDTITVRVKGFEDESFVFESGFKANTSQYFSAVSLFYNNYCDFKYLLPYEKKVKFEERNLSDIPNAEMVEGEIAYSKWGFDRERQLVEYNVSKKYESRTRNIRANYSARKIDAKADIFPITLIRYDFDNKKDMIAVMDGVEGKYITAPTFITAGKVLSVLVSTLFPAAFIFIAYYVNEIILKGGDLPYKTHMYAAGIICALVLWISEYFDQKGKGFFKKKTTKWLFNLSVAIIFSIVTIGCIRVTSPTEMSKIENAAGIMTNSHERLRIFEGTGEWYGAEKLVVTEEFDGWHFSQVTHGYEWCEKDLIEINDEKAIFRIPYTESIQEYEMVMNEDGTMDITERVIRNEKVVREVTYNYYKLKK